MHHEKGQVSNLSFFVVHHPSELVTRQTSLPLFVNLRSKFLSRAPIAKGYGKRQYSVLLQDTELCRGTPACGIRQYSILLQDTEVCRGTPACGKRQYSLRRTKRQWDIIALLDSNGEIVIKYTYDAWATMRLKPWIKQLTRYLKLGYKKNIIYVRLGTKISSELKNSPYIIRYFPW